MTQTNPSHFDDPLRQALKSAEKDSGFSTATFFSKWFREFGHPYFFLFKKNLKVTNIQFAELTSLLRTHAHNSGGDPCQNGLQFFSVKRFNAAVAELVNAFPSNPSRARCDLIAELYGSLLRNAVVTTAFFGSCAVFLPPHLEVDLLPICAHSGYIHSCGESVFIRNVDKTTMDDFFTRVDLYIENKSPNTLPFFAVYTHEDFTDYDRALAADLRDGLDDVKIYLEKFHMGEHRLVAVLNKMKSRFDSRLDIPDAGDFHEKHQRVQDRPRTLWLIMDHSIGQEPHQKGKDRYYICYDQIYVNENPFHVFDENKPAWKAHTTIPHTLAGAMINVTCPWWPKDREATIVDPCVGTGTTVLELVKFPIEVKSKASDIDPFSPLLADDNLEFFAASVPELSAFHSALNRIIDTKSRLTEVEGDSHQSLDVKAAYIWAVELIQRLRLEQGVNGGTIAITDEVVVELREKTLFDRLLFYVGIRTTIRHAAGFESGSIDWETAFQKEARLLARQVHTLIGIRRQERAGPEIGVDIPEGIVLMQGQYSQSCTVSPEVLQTAKKLNDAKPDLVQVNDIRKLKENSCDVIITDLPYGFNTDESPEELAQLYSDALDKMIAALRKEGQLVLSLLDRSHTGRQSLYFTNKSIVIEQVLVKAKEQGYEVLSPSDRVPQPYDVFKLPYYWESERALRRAILHFRLRSTTV